MILSDAFPIKTILTYHFDDPLRSFRREEMWKEVSALEKNGSLDCIFVDSGSSTMVCIFDVQHPPIARQTESNRPCSRTCR